MAIPSQVLNVPVTGGLNTKPNVNDLQPGELAVANNVEYVTTNAIRKREGLIPFYNGEFNLKRENGDFLTSIRKVYGFNDKYICFDNNSCRVLTDDHNIGFLYWKSLNNNTYNVDVKLNHVNGITLNSTTGAISDVTIVFVNNFVCYVYRLTDTGNSSIVCTVEDFSTKAILGTVYFTDIIINTDGITTGTSCIRAIPLSGKCAIICRSASGTITAKYFDPSQVINYNNFAQEQSTLIPGSPTVTSIFSVTDVATDASGGLFDAIPINGSLTEAAIVYRTASGYRLRGFTLSGLVVSQDQSVTSSSTNALTLWQETQAPNSLIYVASASTTDVRYSVFSSDASFTPNLLISNKLVIAMTNVTRLTGCGYQFSQQSMLLIDSAVSVGVGDRQIIKTVLGGAGAGSVTQFTYTYPENVTLLANAFTNTSDNANVFFGGAYNFDRTQCVSFLMGNSDNDINNVFFVLGAQTPFGQGFVGRVGIGELMNRLNYASSAPTSQVVQLDSNTFRYAVCTLEGINPDGTVKTGIGYVDIKFNADKDISLVLDQNAFYVNAGMLFYSDAVTYSCHGFNWFPSLKSFSGAAGAGTIIYTSIYTWRDNEGRVWRSAPASPLTVTSASPITVNYTQPGYDGKFSQLEIYRTTVNGSTFYRVLNPSDSDAVIQGHEILYTDGGEVPNSPIASPSAIAKKGNRLYAVVNDNELWFTKPDSDGVGPQFSNQFSMLIGSDTEKLTALAPLDDKLIMFTLDSAFVLSGDGPTNVDVGDFFGPQQIANSLGCLDVQSPISMEQGVVFKSRRGIYLLDRGLNFSYIGAPVEAYNQRVIVQSVHVPWKNQLRFVLSTPSSIVSNGDTPNCLVYDLFSQRWTTFAFAGLFYPNATDFSGAAVIGGEFFIVPNSSSTFFKQSSGASSVFTDNNQSYKMKLQTGFVNLQDTMSFKRVKFVGVLGNILSTNIAIWDVRVSLISSFDTGSTQTFVKSLTSSGSPGQPILLRVKPTVQKLSSLSIVFDEVIGNQYANVSINGFSLEVGGKAGMLKLSPANSL